MDAGIDERLSLIDPRTLAAFKETDYRVDGTMRLPLRIGERHVELAELHARHHVMASTFLTAANPFSQPQDETSNARQLRILAEELTRRCLPFLSAEARHPTNGWPAEASFLVLGVSVDEAATLGRRYRQNAVLWSGADAVPRLILLR